MVVVVVVVGGGGWWWWVVVVVGGGRPVEATEDHRGKFPRTVLGPCREAVLYQRRQDP